MKITKEILTFDISERIISQTNLKLIEVIDKAGSATNCCWCCWPWPLGVHQLYVPYCGHASAALHFSSTCVSTTKQLEFWVGLFLREFWGVSNIGLSSRVNNFYSLILICTWTAGRKPEAHQEYKPQKTCESQPQPLQPVTLWTWSVGCVRCVVLMIHFPLLGTLIIHILSCECESCEVVIPLYTCENTKAMAMAATSLLPWPILLHTSGHQRMIHYWFMPCQVGKIANEGY